MIDDLPQGCDSCKGFAIAECEYVSCRDRDDKVIRDDMTQARLPEAIQEHRTRFEVAIE
jgi:phosphate starvation-inducible protein PhoH